MHAARQEDAPLPVELHNSVVTRPVHVHQWGGSPSCASLVKSVATNTMIDYFYIKVEVSDGSGAHGDIVHNIRSLLSLQLQHAVWTHSWITPAIKESRLFIFLLISSCTCAYNPHSPTQSRHNAIFSFSDSCSELHMARAFLRHIYTKILSHRQIAILTRKLTCSSILFRRSTFREGTNCKCNFRRITVPQQICVHIPQFTKPL